MAVSAENWSESYAYDAAGNQTAAQWPDHAGRTAARGERTYSGTRLLTAGRIQYAYDGAGRTLRRQKTRLSRKADTWRYEWDAEDRLIACSTPDGTVWNYTYDPLGRRTAKRRLAADGSAAEETVFTWDGTRLAEQTTPPYRRHADLGSRRPPPPDTDRATARPGPVRDRLPFLRHRHRSRRDAHGPRR
ncbi:RHS repeat domain-containing protein [Streptomyces sp. NPDC059122]|uniref:RHS repeat domain-containing protein n=1 Tax=Streptomyces sp. NPDC059122 TaxID=3346732 RepID=UPI00368D4469